MSEPQGLEFGASMASGAGIGIASIQILAPKESRKSIVFVNDSVNLIYLSKTLPATVATGIRLNANGGSWEENDKIGYIWKGPWYAIASAAASNLCILEDW